MRTLLLAAVAVLAAPGTAFADFSAFPGSPVRTGGQPAAVVAADFDGDTRLDLAVANEATDNVTVLLRGANGTYAEEAGSPVAVGDGPVSLAADDFDGDGRRDLAVANFSSGNVTILLRRAAGGFEAAQTIKTGSLTSSVAVADFDLDNRPDLAVTNQDSGTVAILLRRAGGFVAEAGSPIAVGAGPHEVAVAQFDGDFGPDLAITNRGGGNVTILLRQAGGGFAPAQGSPIGVGTMPLGIVAADFDNDDDNDLAVANWGSDTVTVLVNQGLGRFTPGQSHAVGDEPYGIATGDFDRDGRLDLAVSLESAGAVSVWLGSALGFVAGIGSPFGGLGAPRRLAVADLDRDGRPDLAVPDHGADGLALLRNVVGTRITSGPAGVTDDATPTFAFDSDAVGATFECALDGGVFAPCETPFTTAPLPDGPHTFAVRAVGDPTPATRAFTVNTQPPVPTVTPTPTPGPPLPAGPPPRNVTPPAIYGGVVPRIYTCTPGAWENVAPDAAYEYQWYRVFSFAKPVLVGSGSSYTQPPAYAGDTFVCSVTARNAFGATTAAGSRVILSGLPATPVITTGVAFGNFTVRGIDVFQTVQPTSGALTYGFPSGAFPVVAGGGTPTNYVPGGTLAGDPRRVEYRGVSLDAGKPATAIVYVNMTAAAATSAGTPLEVTLRFLRNGVQIGSAVRTITNPAVSPAPYVTLVERDNTNYGVQFPLPGYVLGGGEIALQADVGFSALDAAIGRRECDADGCAADNRFRLDGIPVFQLPSLTILGVEFYGRGQQNGVLTGRSAPVGGGPERANGDLVLAKARQVWPGGEGMIVPTVARLDVGDEENYALEDDECDDIDAPDVRTCHQFYVTQRALAWRTDDPVAKGAGPYQATFGFFNYGGEPGWTSTTCCPTWATFNPHFGASPLFFGDSGTLGRPLTAAAHELGHVFSAPHAGRDLDPDPKVDAACGGDSNGQVGEAWPPDDSGRLLGVRFDRSKVVGGVIDPQPDQEPKPNQLFDLMSYCAPEANAWVSARNWNRAFGVLLDLGARMKAPGRRLAAAPARGQAFAVGVIGAGGGRLTRVVPPDGDDRVPASVASSPIRLRALDAGGAVIGESGATLAGTTEAPAGQGAFVGPVPAGAAAIELVRDGIVLDTLRRSATPRVRLLRPGRGTRVGARLEVRWTASDPDGGARQATVERGADGGARQATVDGGARQATVDGGARQATVEYSADGGRVWRAVFDGPDRGRASIPGALLAGSPRGRVRVTVSDGFSEASAVSPPFVAAGAPATVRIVSAGPAVAGERTLLVGRALDALQRRLSGRSLTWFAGARRLGSGERLTVRLPAGRVVLRLVAGRGEARQTLRVDRARLQVLAVTVPPRVKRGATRVTLRVRVSAATTLIASGHTTRLRAGANRVALTLPRRPAVGMLRLPVKIGPSRATLTVLRS